MSKSNDGNIKCYFHDKLCLCATIWLLENTLDFFIIMVAGLWIYVAILVRFIMDQENLPQQQLVYILEFHLQQTQSNTKSSVTTKLDAFYQMIISQISSKHLPIIQQLLLINHTTFEAILYTLSNFQGLTLENLKHTLSKLYSVIIFISKKRGWKEPFSSSICISFYYTSFMEFLLNKIRSEKYWFENHHYYTTLAIKVLYLFKALYMMYGISQGTSFISDNISFYEQNQQMREFQSYKNYFMYSQMRLSLLVNA